MTARKKKPTETSDLIEFPPVEALIDFSTKADNPADFPIGLCHATVSDARVVSTSNGLLQLAMDLTLDVADAAGTPFTVTSWIALKSERALSAASPVRARIARDLQLLKPLLAGVDGPLTADAIVAGVTGQRVLTVIGQRWLGGVIELQAKTVRPL